MKVIFLQFPMENAHSLGLRRRNSDKWPMPAQSPYCPNGQMRKCNYRCSYAHLRSASCGSILKYIVISVSKKQRGVFQWLRKRLKKTLNLDSILFKCRDILRKARNSGSFFEKRDMMLTLVFLRFIGEKFDDGIEALRQKLIEMDFDPDDDKIRAAFF